jgi:hypothetical protein
VVEPLAIPAKFPSAALHVHYARGLSLAEAFYRSIEGPYQLLIIGDPLCQPWAVFPEVTVTGLPDAEPLTGIVSLSASAKYPDQRMATRFELYIDGLRIQSTKPGEPFQFDTTQHADGWHEVRIVAIDNTDAATQGAKIASMEIKNGADTLQIKAESMRIAASEMTSATLLRTANQDAVIMHNGRALGRLPEGRGRVKISGAALGKGKAQIYAVQVRDGKEVLRSRPVSIEVY